MQKEQQNHLKREQMAKFKVTRTSFRSYKDGTFRICFFDSRTHTTKSVPLDKTDKNNFRSDMSVSKKQALMSKYYKRIKL